MAGADEDRDLAAEYVLGTLDAAEHAAFEARLSNDAALAAEVTAWERRLVALNGETAEVEPPQNTYARILNRIAPSDMSNVVQLKRRIAAWRTAAIAVSALAASLLFFLTLRGGWQTPPQKGLYVAVLQGNGATPAFVAAVDVKNKVMVVRRLAESASADHSYELWALGAGRAKPQPLGVVDAAARIPSERLGRTGDADLADTTLAVSLEPEGGSPTGQPTGPVLFTGKLLATE